MSAKRKAVALWLTAFLFTGCATTPPLETISSGEQVISPSEPMLVTPSPARIESDNPAGITVMTYNILGGIAPANWYPGIDVAELDPMVRAPGIVEKIRFAQPDVVGFQEFKWESASGAFLREQLADFTWVQLGSIVDDDEIPIAVRTDKYEMLSSGQKSITRDSKSNFERYLSWVELWDVAAKRRLFIFNTHLHPWQQGIYAQVRANEVGQIIDLIHQVNADNVPYVLLGDFNARSDEKRSGFKDLLTKLKVAGLTDSYTIAKKDTSDVPRAASMNSMQGWIDGVKTFRVVKQLADSRHYDYIWVPQKTTVYTWQTLSGPNVEWKKSKGKKVPFFTGIIPSDHSPVIARLELK